LDATLRHGEREPPPDVRVLATGAPTADEPAGIERPVRTITRANFDGRAPERERATGGLEVTIKVRIS